MARELHGSHPCVFFLLQRGVGVTHTGSNQLGNPAFHQFLRQFRVFQLVAYRHAPPRAHQLRQIGIQRMEGETCHLRRGCSAPVIAVGERDIQYLAGFHSVLAIGLVEVAAPKQQHRIRVLRLDVSKLLHHWG